MARKDCFTILSTLFAALVASHAPGATSYVVPAEFPATIFNSYYLKAEPTRQPQPAVFDPVLKETYPLKLTDPNTLPKRDPDAPILPEPVGGVPPAEYDQYMKRAIKRIAKIAEDKSIKGDCAKCTESLVVLQDLARHVPSKTPETLVRLCKHYKIESDDACEEAYGLYTLGSVWTQVLAFADVKGLDAQYICYELNEVCPKPTAFPPLDTNGLFPKPKPDNPTIPKPSGERIKVLHLSDVHLDPRYAVGAEANCTSGLCCRTDATNDDVRSGKTVLQAPLYGSFACDTPYFLGVGALQSIHPLTGTENSSSSLGFTIYTGDLVSHDAQSQLSRNYTLYEEASIYHMFHKLIRGNIFPTLGNHDTNPEAQDAPHSLPGQLGQQFSWNYDHVAGLWMKDGWLSPSEAEQARLHYGGYSVKTQYGLRIITLNTDFWYHSNVFNNVKTANPDVSGMLHWIISELQSAEDNGERVWIMGHVLSGWDGSNTLPNPTNLFYTIIERYSPHVIANVFFGHSHEDQQMIYYAHNGTRRNTAAGIKDALTAGWVCPSITPLSNLNSGFRMYEVDTGTFDVYEAYTFYSDVNKFPNLDVSRTGPKFEFEYSTREAYGEAAGWPKDAPLNATFWHALTVAMEKEADMAASKGTPLTLAERFNTYQSKMSIKSPKCNTVACARAKLCYMRSGSAPLGQECPQGYGSTQQPFDPPPS